MTLETIGGIAFIIIIIYILTLVIFGGLSGMKMYDEEIAALQSKLQKLSEELETIRKGEENRGGEE